MIKVNDISKSFGKVTAVKNLSFQISEGEIVGLLGPNGAGKTTCMRMLTGFLYPDTGEIEIDNVSVLKNPVVAQSLLGYLPENNPLYKDMLVQEMLEYSGSIKGLSGIALEEALKYVVSAVNIKEVYYRPIRELSKGYKQRVGIAIALLHKPRVLVLDEPTEGLDPNQRIEIRNLIKDLAKKHTIIISTHVMQEVEALCTRLIVVNKGLKVADGTVSELTHQLKGKSVMHLSIEGKNVAEEIKKMDGISDLEIKENKNIVDMHFAFDAANPLQPEISKLANKNAWIIWNLSMQSQNLEDLFKELTK